MEILLSFFESFSLTSEPMLLLLPFIILFYYSFSFFGYKKFFLILIGILFFWAITQFSLLAVGMIIFLSLLNFILLRYYQTSSSKVILYIAFIFNLWALIILKYIANTTIFLNDFGHFVGFIGISFYIFHVWSIFMDIYYCKINKPIELSTFLVYLLYFPKIITGPFVRYNDFGKELLRENPNETFVTEGVGLLLYGMIIKAFADYVALYPLNIYTNPEGYSGFEHLSAMYGYTIYIFLDFAAYTNIARGISRLFGIELPINFLSPYRSLSIMDFWRRWHISLSNWIRDYIYIPLGGSKKGTFRMYVNLFTAFFLSGLWHGVGLNYAVWGAIHGFGIIINKFFTNRLSLPILIAWFITFHWICIGWIFFANPIDIAFLSLLKILTEFDVSIIKSIFFNNLIWYILLFISFIISLWDNFILMKWLKIFIAINFFFRIMLFWLVLWLILVSHQGSVNTFIYQNF